MVGCSLQVMPGHASCSDRGSDTALLTNWQSYIKARGSQPLSAVGSLCTVPFLLVANPYCLCFKYFAPLF